MSASVVIGQSDFISGSVNQGGTVSASSLWNPYSCIVVDNKLIVNDYGNNRVLIWNSIPTANGTSADVVIGQPDFTHNSQDQGGSIGANTLNQPQGGLASDGTRLFIADSYNNRVLIFNSIPTTNNASADVVVGQTSMTSRSSIPGISASTLGYTLGVSYDSQSGKLIIPDWYQHRVLIFNSVPKTNGASADVVVGQTNLSSYNSIPIHTAAGFYRAFYAQAYNGKLFVVPDENRVLIWNSIPTTNGVSADVVVGQSNFTGYSINQGASVGANTLYSPNDPFFNAGRMFIPDAGNSRVLVFNSIPATNNAQADIVIGQSDFTSNTANQGSSVGSNTVKFPHRGCFDGNRMILVDGGNHRVLIFNNTIATPELSLTGVEEVPDGRLKLNGNIKMGEAGHYDLGGGGGVSFEVNGVGGSGEVSIGNQTNSGSGSLGYDFSNTFEPWVNNGTRESWTKEKGYTVKVTSRNSNADASSAFWFSPFKAVSLGSGLVKFSVNKYQVQRIKDNVSFFDVLVKKVPIPKSNLDTPWVKLMENISTDDIDSQGNITTPLVNTLSLISKGNYLVKIESVAKHSNVRQDSDTVQVNLTTPITPTSYINPFNYQTNSSFWFPIQLTKSPSISSPTITGIAFAGSTVAVRVVSTTTGKYKDYTTTTNPASRFSITPSIPGPSTLTISVYDTSGHYNFLTPISVR